MFVLFPSVPGGGCGAAHEHAKADVAESKRTSEATNFIAPVAYEQEIDNCSLFDSAELDTAAGSQANSFF